VQASNKKTYFEQLMLPHLDAAFNLARWLTRNDQDAEDVVQEAYLRAFKSFGTFHGTASRAWLLTIVRNTCYSWLQRNQQHAEQFTFDDELDRIDCDGPNAEKLLLEQADYELLNEALNELPLEFREAFVLRELEDMAYKEIAQITHVPLGTVMSRLARARKRLQQSLAKRMNGA